MHIDDSNDNKALLNFQPVLPNDYRLNKFKHGLIILVWLQANSADRATTFWDCADRLEY